MFKGATVINIVLWNCLKAELIQITASLTMQLLFLFALPLSGVFMKVSLAEPSRTPRCHCFDTPVRMSLSVLLVIN